MINYHKIHSKLTFPQPENNFFSYSSEYEDNSRFTTDRGDYDVDYTAPTTAAPTIDVGFLEVRIDLSRSR